jgi:hypothetical protein
MSANTQFIENLTTDQILSVYSGRDGHCCCGCNGNHYYSSKHRDEGSKHRGYKVLDGDVNDRMITRVLNTFKRNLSGIEVVVNDHAALVIGKRLYIICFADKVTEPAHA